MVIYFSKTTFNFSFQTQTCTNFSFKYKTWFCCILTHVLKKVLLHITYDGFPMLLSGSACTLIRATKIALGLLPGDGAATAVVALAAIRCLDKGVGTQEAAYLRIIHPLVHVDQPKGRDVLMAGKAPADIEVALAHRAVGAGVALIAPAQVVNSAAVVMADDVFVTPLPNTPTPFFYSGELTMAQHI